MGIQEAPKQEVKLIGISQQLGASSKRRRNKGNGPLHQTPTSDESTCASLSSNSSSETKANRRRRGPRRKRTRGKERHNNANQQQVMLSQDEQALYLALDCEMVGVGYRGTKSSVARVTLVDWSGNIVFDELIQQDTEVTDYRSFVSGITAEDLRTATWSPTDCRERVLELLDGKVLVGHALKNDLKALSITHPWYMTRDTAKYEPFQQIRFDDGVLWPRKLKDLVKEKLKRDIQVDGEPHSALEDAVAALDLYRMARRKWEKVMAYKIAKTQEIQQNQAGMKPSQ